MPHYPTVLIVAPNEAEKISLDIFANPSALRHILESFVNRRLANLVGDTNPEYFSDYFSVVSAAPLSRYYKELSPYLFVSIRAMNNKLNEMFPEDKSGACDYILPEPGWMKHWLFCNKMPNCEHMQSGQSPICYENPSFNWEGVLENLGDYPCLMLDVHR